MKTFTIGRDPMCQIVMPHTSISRNHAILRVYDNGTMELIDTSHNGTLVNGIRIHPNVPYPVKRTDVIAFPSGGTLNWDLIQDTKAKEQKISMFLMTYNDYLPSTRIPMIRSELMKMDESRLSGLMCMNFKKPLTALLLSFLAFWGISGVDRMYIGDTGLGVAKLLTCGGLGIWSIVDFFPIMDATKEKNFEQLQQLFMA